MTHNHYQLRVSRFTKPRRWLAGSLSLGLLTGQMIMLLPIRPAFAGPNVCATPGRDGPVNLSDIVNTYFPPLGETVLSSGQTSVLLDSYYTEGSNVPIAEGDMLMIIQMQDATIDSSNTAAYGSGNAANGGKGQISLGNSGVYEFVRATNAVPLSGGTLNFVGGNTNDGVINTYNNTSATPARGRRTFQIIRVVQYASLSLTSDVTVPDWDGQVGGVMALDIAGDMNFSGFTIDATERGFRGGFIPNDTASGGNNGIYVAPTTSTEVGGKGEGIAGTPRYLWDGTTAVDLGSEQLPGGDAGRGAPGNAAGGGNAHNAGGGGGGNGGEGGFGGIGWEGAGGDLLGSRGLGGAVPVPNPVGSRLIMGGGGGGGDVNNDANGIRGGQGGGVVMIRADRFVGTGRVVSNGSEGEEGEVFSAPDGAGGGGAGGTVALIARSGDLSGLSVEAVGGQGGNTSGDANIEHGPGGGGGGGVVVSTSPGGQVPAPNLAGGLSGRANSGAGIPHGATDGAPGVVGTVNPAAVPPALQGANCFPSLTVTKTEDNPGDSGSRTAPSTANYTITVSNAGPGGATGARLSDVLPTGFTYDAGATAVFGGGATGPTSPDNSGTASSLEFGDYTIPEGGSVAVTFPVDIAAGTAAGTYQNPAFVSYFDPSRVTSGRQVSPEIGANIGAAQTTYESGARGGQPVDGTNYVATSSAGEDVVIVPVVPNVSLVKRITAVNGQAINPNDGRDLSQFVDDMTSPFAATDNNPNWPADYLVGEFEAGAVQPGDELEYTVYFLSSGNLDAEDVRLCDRLLPNQSFVTDAYGAGIDVELQLGTSPVIGLTAADDAGDRTEFITPGEPVAATCNLQGPNDDGTLVIDVTGPAGTGEPTLTVLPSSTGPGAPNDAYGLFRFRTRIAP